MKKIIYSIVGVFTLTLAITGCKNTTTPVDTDSTEVYVDSILNDTIVTDSVDAFYCW